MGIPLLRGRSFESRDAAESPRAVVINETLAKAFWPGQDPLGKRIAMSWGLPVEAEIVGVVGDVRLTALDAEPRPTLYWSLDQLPNNFMSVLLRARGNPMELAGALRAQVCEPSIPINRWRAYKPWSRFCRPH
jgi:hypothetical protein